MSWNGIPALMHSQVFFLTWFQTHLQLIKETSKSVALMPRNSNDGRAGRRNAQGVFPSSSSCLKGLFKSKLGVPSVSIKQMEHLQGRGGCIFRLQMKLLFFQTSNLPTLTLCHIMQFYGKSLKLCLIYLLRQQDSWLLQYPHNHREFLEVEHNRFWSESRDFSAFSLKKKE